MAKLLRSRTKKLQSKKYVNPKNSKNLQKSLEISASQDFA